MVFFFPISWRGSNSFFTQWCRIAEWSDGSTDTRVEFSFGRCRSVTVICVFSRSNLYWLKTKAYRQHTYLVRVFFHDNMFDSHASSFFRWKVPRFIPLKKHGYLGLAKCQVPTTTTTIIHPKYNSWRFVIKLDCKAEVTLRCYTTCSFNFELSKKQSRQSIRNNS